MKEQSNEKLYISTPSNVTKIRRLITNLILETRLEPAIIELHYTMNSEYEAAVLIRSQPSGIFKSWLCKNIYLMTYEIMNQSVPTKFISVLNIIQLWNIQYISNLYFIFRQK